MKRPAWLNGIFYGIWAILLILVAWKFILVPLYKTYQLHKLDASYALTQAFSNYESALFNRIDLNKKIEKASEQQKSQLLQEAPNLDKKVAESAKDLDTALTKIKKYYSKNALVEKRIEAFQEWKNQSEKQIVQSTNSDWDLPFLNLYIGVNRAINKAETGYEDPTKAENEKIMSLVPAAEQALKNHPNDKKLCTVMQQPLYSLDRNLRLSAQQIAFMNVGDQYCSHYYTDRAAWGVWGMKSRVATPPTPSAEERPAYPTAKTIEEKPSTNNIEDSNNQKYGSLPYSQYYNQYVIPLIPKFIETLKNPKENTNMCMTASWSTGARNPERDAARAAYVQAGKQYCPPDTTERGYYTTGVPCLIFCDALCAEGSACDCVERCKQTPGVLFKDNP